MIVVSKMNLKLIQFRKKKINDFDKLYFNCLNIKLIL